MKDVAMLLVVAPLRLYFGTAYWLLIVLEVFRLAGLWQMLKKSGVSGWYALIPGIREYQLSRCAGREREGRRLLLFTLLNRVLLAYRADSAMTFLFVAVGIAVFVYNVRVCSGLVWVYNTGRGWLWLWALPWLNCLPPMIWGFDPEYQPQWQALDLEEEED